MRDGAVARQTHPTARPAATARASVTAEATGLTSGTVDCVAATRSSVEMAPMTSERSQTSLLMLRISRVRSRLKDLDH